MSEGAFDHERFVEARRNDWIDLMEEEKRRRWAARAGDENDRPIPFKKTHPDAIMPTKSFEHDAGWDLYSIEDVSLGPWECVRVRTGVAVAIFPGDAGRVAERSGFSTNNKVSIRGKEIDAGYRDEIEVALHYLSPEGRLYVSKGQRIAQLIIYPIRTNPIKEYDDLPPSQRGARGFGSTGK